MASAPWKSRLGRLSPLLEDPNIREIFVATNGTIFVRYPGATNEIADPISQSELRGLIRMLARSLDESLSADNPEVSGVLDDFDVQIVSPPISPNGSTVLLSRHSSTRSTMEGLLANGVITSGMSDFLSQTLVSQSSIVLVGARRTGRRDLLTALAQSVSRERRVASINLNWDDPSGQHIALSSEAGVEVASSLGVELLVVHEPELELWPKLLLSPCPFIATFESPDMWTGLKRLCASLLFQQPGLSREGAELMVESVVGLLVEVGQRVGELSPQVLAFAEPRRLKDQLTLRPLARRRPDGSDEMTLAGSQLVERFGSVGGRSSRPPGYTPGQLPPPSESHPDALAAVQGVGGAVSDDFVDTTDQSEPPRVGRVSARELSMLRPEQLVSKSFLVDVSDVDQEIKSGTHIKNWDEGENSGPTSRSRTDDLNTGQPINPDDLRSTSARAAVSDSSVRLLPNQDDTTIPPPPKGGAPSKSGLHAKAAESPKARDNSGLRAPRRAERASTEIGRPPSVGMPDTIQPSAEDENEPAAFSDGDETIGGEDGDGDGDFDQGTPVIFSDEFPPTGDRSLQAEDEPTVDGTDLLGQSLSDMLGEKRVGQSADETLILGDATGPKSVDDVRDNRDRGDPTPVDPRTLPRRGRSNRP